MTAADMKIAVVIAWTLIWSVIAVTLATSLSNWILWVGCGVLPPLMILRMWQPPVRPVAAPVRKVPAGVVKGAARYTLRATAGSSYPYLSS